MARDGAGRKRRLVVGRVIHRGGGAGRICAVKGDPKSVVKLYHDPAKAGHYKPKIEAMLARPPELPAIERDGRRFVQIAWPTALLEDARGRFVGFVMPFIDLAHADSLDTLLVKALRQQRGWPENYAFRVYAAQNVAAMVAELHRLGHHIIDLKPQNLSVYKDTMYVAVVDCDGLSIAGASDRRFPGHQFTDGYRAHEGVRDGLDPEQLGEEQDRFALAVVLFQLLNNGVHPFQGVPTKRGMQLGTEQERINAGLYAYDASPNPYQGPSPASLHESLEDKTRALFHRAFTGRRRPSAREWRDHLRELIDRRILVPCKDNPEAHAHFSKGCGLCRLDQTIRQRAAAARQRPKAQTRQRAQPRRPGRVVFRHRTRARTRQTRGTAPPAPRRVGGIWQRTKRWLFGTPRRAPPGRKTDWAVMFLLHLVYGIFCLNLLAIALILVISFNQREFYWLADLVEGSEYLWDTGSTSRRGRLEAIVLMILFYGGCLTVGGLFVSYFTRATAPGTLAESHGTWVIRTFWLSIALALVSAVLTPVSWPFGVVFPPLQYLWLIYRCAKGTYLLKAGKPIPDPKAWL